MTHISTSTMSRRSVLAKASLGGCLLASGAWVHAQALTNEDAVSLEVARMAHESGRAVLIDIREPSEHAMGVAKGAKLLPMSQIGARVSEIPTATDKPVYLICNTQNRSSSTLRALRQRGYKHVRYVHGGMSDWARRGWPMVKP